MSRTNFRLPRNCGKKRRFKAENSANRVKNPNSRKKGDGGMLIRVHVSREKAADGSQTIALRPTGFPACGSREAELPTAITRTHLKLEGAITELLISGHSPAEIAAMTRPEAALSSAEDFDIHINLDHLSAVARHQTRPR